MKQTFLALRHSAVLRTAGLFILLFPAGGCLHPTHLTFIVPSHCIKVTVESFTRPCNQLADGKLLCNAVVISANCVQLPRKSAIQ